MVSCHSQVCVIFRFTQSPVIMNMQNCTPVLTSAEINNLVKSYSNKIHLNKIWGKKVIGDLLAYAYILWVSYIDIIADR